MQPVFLKIGRWTLNSYSVFFVLGAIAAIFVLRSEARRQGWDVRSTTGMALRCLALGFVGAHLLFCLTRLELSWVDWWRTFFQFGYGNVWYGGFVTGWLVVRRHASITGIPSFKLYDSVALAALLAQAIGRIGCFFGGCCFGATTSLPWGVLATRGELSGFRLHPWPLYESVYSLLLLACLWRVRVGRPAGYVAVHYLLWTAMGRFFLEYLRGDAIRGFVWPGLSTSQCVAIAVFVLGTASYRRLLGQPDNVQVPSTMTRP